MGRSVNELITIAAGGGFAIDANIFAQRDLITIAAAAGEKGGRIHILNADTKETEELILIAAAGKGCVFFELESIAR